MSFTFLNVSDGPSLSKQAAKQMRGHVTKVNFAARRNRKRKAGVARPSRAQGKSSITPSKSDGAVKWNADAEQFYSELMAHFPDDPCPSRLEILRSLEMVITHSRSGKHDKTRLSVIYSEPALVEAMLSVIVRYYTLPAFACPRYSPELETSQLFPRGLLAEFHSRRALALAIERVGSPKGYTDGLLETIGTLALSARFVGDSAAYEIHVSGMVDILRSRRKKGITGIPAAIRDGLILSLFDRVLGYPRMYHDKMVEEISHGYPIVSILATMTQDLLRFRCEASQTRPSYNGDPFSLPPGLSKLWMRVFLGANALRLHDNIYVKAVVVAIDIILRINAPGYADGNIESFATELKGFVSEFPHRWCVLMDVTSSLMWLGAVVARRDSEAAEWFTEKLRAGMRVLRSAELEGLCSTLYAHLFTDSPVIAARFQQKWAEVVTQER